MNTKVPVLDPDMPIAPQDPKTPEEWQEAANVAHLCLALDSCYQYGLLTGPPINVERCEWVLREATKRGITPKDFAR